MPDIYTTKPGRVGVIKADGTIPGSVEIIGTGGSDRMSAMTKVIITAIGYNQMCNVQFMQTLDNAIYVYSFGDKMGEIQVQGLAFAGLSCEEDGESGIIDLLDYYRNNRLAVTGEPITVSIGSEVLKGFLVGCRIITQSTEHLTYAFVLEIAALPEQLAQAVGGGN